MRKRDHSVLRILSRTEPSIARALAEEALEMANKLPDTVVEVPIERGIKEGWVVRVREGVVKLVGRGIERE